MTQQLDQEWTPATHPRTDVVRRFLTPYEVARYCGVPNEEVLSWIDSGKLRATYLPIGRYRIAVPDLMVFLHRFGVAI
jgi:excisionase family DNA binding protein